MRPDKLNRFTFAPETRKNSLNVTNYIEFSPFFTLFEQSAGWNISIAGVEFNYHNCRGYLFCPGTMFSRAGAESMIRI